MNQHLIRDLLVGIGVVVLQIVLFRHLRFYGTEPDIVLIYLLWLIAHRSRTAVLVYGAFFGLMQDALLDLWGLHMFAKTLTVILTYTFIPKEGDTRLLIWQAFLMILAFAFTHNLILLVLANLVDAYTTGAYFWLYLLGNSLFTALLGSFFYFSRDK